VEVKSFDSALLEKKFVIESNLRRRHLNLLDKTKLAMEREVIETELAKQRQSIQGVQSQDYVPSLISNETDLGKAIDIAAAKCGLKPTTYFREAGALKRFGCSG
jgi:hypothetical protein